MRLEINQATKENKMFAHAVEMSKMESTREEKRRRKKEKSDQDWDDMGSNEPSKKPNMQFKQHAVRDKEVRLKPKNDNMKRKAENGMQGVLTKIF